MPGRWIGSTRRARLPRNWPAIREAVLRRDHYRCTELIDGVRCTSVATDVDHIVHGDDHRPSNLRALCIEHHKAKSSAEGNTARWAKQGSRRRPDEPHPGLL